MTYMLNTCSKNSVVTTNTIPGFNFQDIGVSKDLNEQFRNHLVKSNESLGIDFSIQVLSSGSWPFQQSFTFGLPSEVSFLSKYSGSVV